MPGIRYRLIVMMLNKLSVAVLIATSIVAAIPAAASPKPSAPSLPQEDRPQLLVPKHPRTEADEDRIQAAALLATARTMEQRQEPAAALRLYQRAYRIDPNAVAALEEIVPLAFSLNRRDESLRYAVKLAQESTSDPELPRRIGMFMAENGNIKMAVKLLARAAKIMDSTDKPAADRLAVDTELARLDFLDGQFADAAALLDKVAAAMAHPKDYGLDEVARQTLAGDGGATYELMANVYLEVDRTKEAAEAFRKFNDMAPKSTILSLNLARVDQKSKHPAEALAKLQTYFDSHPSDLGLGELAFLSEVLKDLKQSDQLVPRLQKLHAAMPNNPAISFDLAERYVKAGKPAEAKPLYASIVKAKPTAEAYQALVKIDRQSGDMPALLQVLGDVAEKTESLDALGDEGKSLAADAKMVDSLLDLAEKNHSAAKPADFGPLLAAASLAADRKEFDRAGKLYDLAIKANPKQKSDLLLTWGLTLLAADKNGQAVKVLQRGLDEGGLPADQPPAFDYYLSEALEMTGKTDQALKLATAMAGKKSAASDVRFLSRPAWVLYHAKRYDEAYRTYKDLIDKHDADFSSEENREALRDARSVLSNICVEQHRLGEAEEWLEQVLDEFPDDAGALNDLGYLWADQNKRLARALVMIQQAVAAEPDNSAYRDSLGWIYFRLGKLDQSLVELKKAVSLDKEPDPAVLEHYADVLTAAKRPAEARENYERALKGYQKDADAEKIKAIEKKLR